MQHCMRQPDCTASLLMWWHLALEVQVQHNLLPAMEVLQRFGNAQRHMLAPARPQPVCALNPAGTAEALSHAGFTKSHDSCRPDEPDCSCCRLPAPVSVQALWQAGGRRQKAGGLYAGQDQTADRHSPYLLYQRYWESGCESAVQRSPPSMYCSVTSHGEQPI